MATRESKLVYSTPGIQASRANVISLAEALAHQERRAAQLAPVLKNAEVRTSTLAAVSQSATAKITSLTNSIGPLGAGLGALARNIPAASQGLFTMMAAMEKTSLLSRMLNTSIMGGAAAALTGGVAIAAYADDALRAADTFATLEARIRTFSKGAIDSAQTQKALYATAAEARTSVGDLTTLYTRLAPAVADYGRSQEDALRITQLTSKALAIQGADVREQAAATVQFSQAVASGVLRGDELRSLLESSPQLLRYIAQNLEINGKVGVAFSQLRKLGEGGLLTTDKLITALLAAQPAIERDFINAPKTAQQGWTVLKDEITRTIGSLDKTLGGQQAVVSWLGQMAQGAEDWRQKMLLDPSALDPVKEAADFIGDAVGSIGALGKVAVDNFDLIVDAGQAIIALKLGEVFASWFSTAAKGAQSALANLQTFRAQAAFQVGAAASPATAEAALAYRSASTAADIAATEKAALAEVRLQQATVARNAAYTAANQVNVLKTRSGVTDAEVTAAQTRATALLTAAERAEAQAKSAQTAAAAAVAAASTRSALAQTAEAAVTGQATRAMVAKNVAMRAGAGLYSLLGGAVGVASLAIGGLVYAVWKAEEAHKANLEAERASVEISEQLRGITDAMTAATWAQVPALQAQAQALLAAADASRKKIEADIQEREARVRGLQAAPGKVLGGDFAEGAAIEAGRTTREIREKQESLKRANADLWKQAHENTRRNLVASTIEASTIQRQLSSGKDAAGRPLSADAKSNMEARLASLFATGQKAVDEWSARVAEQNKVTAGQAGAAKAGAADVAKIYGSIADVAAELVSTADKSSSIKPTAAASKVKKTAVPGMVGGALDELIRQEYRPTGGGDRFTMKGGKIQDGASAFVARSADEAKAASAYVRTLDAIDKATDKQIAKTGETRAALKEAASARLAEAVATSKASDAGEKWADIQEEMGGESRAVIKAQREVNKLQEDNSEITKVMTDRYIEYVTAREKARRVQAGLQFNQPLVQKGFDLALAGAPVPTDSRGVVNEAAAVAQVMAAKEKVILARDQAIRDELDKGLRDGSILEVDLARKTADAIGTYDLAVEISTQEQILEIKKARLQQDAQALEDQIDQSADAIMGALNDVRLGGNILDVGKTLAQDLLTSIYQELIANPLRDMIRGELRRLLSASGGGGGGGFWGKLLSAGMSVVSGGMSASAAASASAATASMQANNAALVAAGFADGGSPGGKVRGPGGPRGDMVNINVSDSEWVMQSSAVRQYGDKFMHDVNAGLYDPYSPASRANFADGGATSGAFYSAPAPSPARAREGDLIVNNMTGVPARAEVTRQPDGSRRLDLKPVFAEGVKGAARDGTLQRYMGQGPQPTRRA